MRASDYARLVEDHGAEEVERWVKLLRADRDATAALISGLNRALKH